MSQPSQDATLQPDAPAWETAAATTSYCTVANARGTEREVELQFGVHEQRDRARGELGVRLLHRITLNPAAAQRLQQLVKQLLAEYPGR